MEVGILIAESYVASRQTFIKVLKDFERRKWLKVENVGDGWYLASTDLNIQIDLVNRKRMHNGKKLFWNFKLCELKLGDEHIFFDISKFPSMWLRISYF